MRVLGGMLWIRAQSGGLLEVAYVSRDFLAIGGSRGGNSGFWFGTAPS